MQTTFKTRINAKQSNGEVTKGEQITVPDASPSMREILVQFHNGISPQNNHKGFYNEDYTLPDFERLDLIDIDNILEDQKNHIQNLKENEKLLKAEIKKRSATQIQETNSNTNLST